MTQTTPVAAPAMPTAPTALAVPPMAPTAEFAPPPPSRTPVLFRRLQAVAAAGLIVLGVAAALIVSGLRADLATAPAVAEQYARLGQVNSLLIEADTLTARSILQRGAAAGRDAAEAADARLVQAAGLLVEAAATRPADTAALAGISQSVVAYGQQLRAASAAGEDAAAASLRTADEVLETRIQPDLDQLQAQLTAESDRDYTAGLGWIMPVLAIGVAGALVWMSWVVAQRSHRVVNPGLVGALVAALVVAGVTIAAQQSAASAVEASRGAALDDVATVSMGSTQLRASERITIRATIDREWGESQENGTEAALTATAAAVNQHGSLPSLAAYRDANDAAISLLEKGDWTGATKLVVATGDESLSSAAEEWATAASDVTQEQVHSAAEAAASTNDTLLAQLVVVILAALGGAVLALVGFAQRLREYR